MRMKSPAAALRLARVCSRALIVTCVSAVLAPVYAKEGEPLTVNLAVKLEAGATVAGPYGKLKVALTRAAGPTDGQLLYVVSPVADRGRKIDVTQFASGTGDAIEIDFASWPLPLEEYELRVHLVELDGKLKLLGTQPFTVVVPSADAPAAAADPDAKPELTIKLDLGVASQVQEKVGGSQHQSQRPHFANLTVQGSIETNNRGEDWEVKSQIQLAGSSYRPDVPNFGRLGVTAPKVDIASYLVETAYRDSRLNIGHISVDAHPLLLTGINNRGFAFQQKLPLGIDLGVTMQSGDSVAGYRNLVGLANRNNQFRQVGLGYDFIQTKPGNFRLDVNAVDARVQSNSGGSSPPPPDESKGVGARLLMRNEPGTLRFEAVAAKSEFRPGVVPQNFPAINRGYARTAEIGYDILKDRALLEKLPLTFTVGYRNEYSSPQYRSLGSGYTANYHIDVGTFTAALGSLKAQLQLTKRYDNVGEARLYLRNRVDGSSFNTSVPLGPFFADNLGKAWALRAPEPKPTAPPAIDPAPSAEAGKESPPAAEPAKESAEPPKPSPWWPTLSFSQTFTHGYGDTNFVPIGYTVDDLPDVYVINRAVGLQWQFERVSFGTKVTRVGQTNRQIGFTNQSSWDKRFSYSVDWKIFDPLSITLAYDPTYNYRYETNVRSDARQLRGGANWKISDTWDAVLDLNYGADFDSGGQRYNRQNTSQINVNHAFSINIPGWKKLPGKGYIRVSESRGFNFAKGSPVLEPTVRRIQLGFTLSVF